jgi:hypothetical protein
MSEGGISAGEEPDQRRLSPPEGVDVRRQPYRWRTSWTAPEIVTGVLLASTLLFAVGDVLDLRGTGGDGWTGEVSRWTYWAVEPWVSTVLVLASLLAWYLAKTARDTLIAMRPSDNDGTQPAQSDDPSAATPWDREQRAVVMAGVAASFGAVTALAVILLVATAEWSTPGGSILILPSRIAGVVEGLAVLIPALATLVIFRRLHAAWRKG